MSDRLTVMHGDMDSAPRWRPDWPASRLGLLLIVLLAGLLAASCGEQEPTPPAADEILAQSVARMQDLAGYAFNLDPSGAPVPLDQDGLLTLGKAEGNYVAPDEAIAVVTVSTPGLVTEVSLISIGDQQWLTNPLTGRWEALPAGWGLDPKALVNPDTGLLGILAGDISQLSLTGTEELEDGPDQGLYALTGMVEGGRIAELSAGMIGPEPMPIQLWIAPDSYELVRVVLSETTPGAEEPTRWQLDFSQFDQTVEISPPELTS